jgi:hypothetical protein
LDCAGQVEIMLRVRACPAFRQSVRFEVHFNRQANSDRLSMPHRRGETVFLGGFDGVHIKIRAERADDVDIAGHTGRIDDQTE